MLNVETLSEEGELLFSHFVVLLKQTFNLRSSRSLFVSWSEDLGYKAPDRGSNVEI